MHALSTPEFPNFTRGRRRGREGRREEENDGGIKWRRLSVVCAPPPPPPPPRNYSTNSPSARAPASVDRPTNKQRGNVRVRPPNFFRVLESNLLEGERGRKGGECKHEDGQLQIFNGEKGRQQPVGRADLVALHWVPEMSKVVGLLLVRTLIKLKSKSHASC